MIVVASAPRRQRRSTTAPTGKGRRASSATPPRNRRHQSTSGLLMPAVARWTHVPIHRRGVTADDLNSLEPVRRASPPRDSGGQTPARPSVWLSVFEPPQREGGLSPQRRPPALPSLETIQKYRAGWAGGKPLRQSGILDHHAHEIPSGTKRRSNSDWFRNADKDGEHFPPA